LLRASWGREVLLAWGSAILLLLGRGRIGLVLLAGWGAGRGWRRIKVSSARRRSVLLLGLVWRRILLLLWRRRIISALGRRASLIETRHDDCSIKQCSYSKLCLQSRRQMEVE
jgi:hypothetical protein